MSRQLKRELALRHRSPHRSWPASRRLSEPTRDDVFRTIGLGAVPFAATSGCHRDLEQLAANAEPWFPLGSSPLLQLAAIPADKPLPAPSLDRPKRASSRRPAGTGESVGAVFARDARTDWGAFFVSTEAARCCGKDSRNLSCWAAGSGSHACDAFRRFHGGQAQWIRNRTRARRNEWGSSRAATTPTVGVRAALPKHLRVEDVSRKFRIQAAQPVYLRYIEVEGDDIEGEDRPPKRPYRAARSRSRARTLRAPSVAASLQCQARAVYSGWG